MRTKTLLLTAALAAAGVASSLAQSVYSVNVVGYINVACQPGFTMIANQLISTNNTVDQMFTANSPDGATILAWNQTLGTFDYNNFAFGAWDFPNATLSPGQGVMYQNPNSTPATFTFVGEVPQGANLSVAFIPGFNMVSSIVPQAGALQTDLGFAPEEGDTILKWNQHLGTYDYWFFTFGAWDPAEPTLAVGESAFVQPGGSTHGNWTRSFTVN